MIFGAYRFQHGLSPVPELKSQRPELFPPDKNYLARNVYHHLLQKSFIEFLTMLYRASWHARALHFEIGSVEFGQYGPAEQSSTVASRMMNTQDLERALGDNWFARIHRWPGPQLALPPGTRLTVTPPTGEGDANSTSELRIENRFCSITLSVEYVFPVRTVGEYRVMAGMSDEEVQDFGANMYVVRENVHYSRLFSGSPEMKAHQEWATQLVNEVRNQFDEQLIWARVKEQDLRSRHYPTEKLTRHGRFPQSSRPPSRPSSRRTRDLHQIPHPDAGAQRPYTSCDLHARPCRLQLLYGPFLGLISRRQLSELPSRFRP
jgi:hypothetical protein